ncbi:unnamed protein product [Mesocestoides corti]|uniref:Uncharacterized protein n=1 Tax=Mesocestoides corti TaxID=53468 RepID=A0A0R3U4K4_MESCO|nr:unnamed protein product [Mesocestoides corti]
MGETVLCQLLRALFETNLSSIWSSDLASKFRVVLDGVTGTRAAGHPPSTSQLDNLTPCFEYLSEGIRSHKVLPCVGANAVRKSYFSARELNNTFIPHGSQLCDLLNSHSLVIRFGDAWLAGGVGEVPKASIVELINSLHEAHFRTAELCSTGGGDVGREPMSNAQSTLVDWLLASRQPQQPAMLRPSSMPSNIQQPAYSALSQILERNIVIGYRVDDVNVFVTLELKLYPCNIPPGSEGSDICTEKDQAKFDH